MKLIFGLQLDDLAEPRPDPVEGGTYYSGRKKLLPLLEAYLGLSGHPDDIEYLRIEQYRQALLHHLALIQQTPLPAGQPFYKKSFEADQFATATELLSRRDELLLAGWDFVAAENTPPRLACLAAIEIYFTGNEEGEAPLQLFHGQAGRFKAVLRELDNRSLPFSEIWLTEPLALLPPHFQSVFKKLSGPGKQAKLHQLPQSSPGSEQTSLHLFQKRLYSPAPVGQAGRKTDAANDGSLFIVRAKRASEAASYLAKILWLNPDFRPTCLIPEKNRTFDMALIREGLPSLGIQSTSLARPAMQILKLAPAFLWEPVDPFKMLEFVSLAVKPLPGDLAAIIANQVAKSPGLQGDGWYAMINRYFEELEASGNNRQKIKEARSQYNFWFERQRYDLDKTVPKSEAIGIFAYLQNWSYREFDEAGGKNNSLLVLSEQARRITELLAALPETELSNLELERIVRTVYEPSPVVFQEKEAHHMPYVTHPGAFIGPVEAVLWWNFTQNEPPHYFSRWYQIEREYLQQSGIELETPAMENARQLWQQARPVLMAKKQLILVVPETINGEEAIPHPLFGDLQAAFTGLDLITFDIDTEEGKEDFSRYFQLPQKVPVERLQLGLPKPFLRIKNLDKLEREYETLTSLESLFFYPYQWVFKYKIKLQKSAILSVVKDQTLMGNLAHRVFEKLLKEEIYRLEKPWLERWVENECRRLFTKEGAVLLMYGREPERVAFVNKLKYAAWSLISHIRENGWQVLQTEMALEGQFPPNGNQPIPVKGVADIVLKRGSEIAVIDLKWRGATYRENVLKNEQDLQLVLYSHLLSEKGRWPHTAYFIIENGKLLSRNNLAFIQASPIAPDKRHEDINAGILASMEATWHWRMQQLENGLVEIRCRQTIQDIEDYYAGEGQASQMLQILEMPGEDASFDDFKTLINLVA